MSQLDRSQLIPDPQQPSRQPGGIQSPRPIAPAHGQQHGAANTSPRPNQGQHQQRQQRSAHGAGHNQGPSHTRVSNNRGPADNRSAKGNKTGGKTAFFVVLGLVAIVYIVGVVAFSQIAYPTPPSPRRYLVFQRLIAATKVNSAWKHYKLTVSGEDLAGPISRIRRAHRRRRGSCPRDYRQQRAAAVAFAPDCLARRQER